jgi:hypothetical protein
MNVVTTTSANVVIPTTVNSYQHQHLRLDDKNDSVFVGGGNSQDEIQTMKVPQDQVADVEQGQVMYSSCCCDDDPLAGNPEDQQQQKEVDDDNLTTTKDSHNMTTAAQRILERIKYVYSMALLLFSEVTVLSSIGSQQTVGTAVHGIPPSWP